MSPRRLESRPHSSHSHARPALPQMHGRTRDSSHDQRGALVLPSPLLVQHPTPARGRLTRILAESTAEAAAASPNPHPPFPQNHVSYRFIGSSTEFEDGQFYRE